MLYLILSSSLYSKFPFTVQFKFYLPRNQIMLVIKILSFIMFF